MFVKALLIILNLKGRQVRRPWPFPVQIIVINHSSKIFHKWITNTVIIIFAIVEYAVAVAKNSCRKHEFNILFKIDYISDISQKAIGVTNFIKDSECFGKRTLFISPKKKFAKGIPGG